MSVSPTKTRLALLGGILAEEIYHLRGDWYDANSVSGLKVTARVVELVRAGWVEVYEDAGVLWQIRLTDAGREVLEEAGAA